MVYGGQYEILNSISKSNNTKVFQAYYSDDESSPRKLIMFKRIAYNKFKESKEEVVKKIKDTH